LEDVYRLIYSSLIYSNRINRCLLLTTITLLTVYILLLKPDFFLTMYITTASWPTS